MRVLLTIACFGALLCSPSLAAEDDASPAETIAVTLASPSEPASGLSDPGAAKVEAAGCLAYWSCSGGTTLFCSCPTGGTCSDGPTGYGGGHVSCDCLDGSSYEATCKCRAHISCVKKNPQCDLICVGEPGTPGNCIEGFDQVTCDGVTYTCAEVDPNRCP